MKRISLIFIFFILSTACLAANLPYPNYFNPNTNEFVDNDIDNSNRPWSGMFYVGAQSSTSLTQIFGLDFSRIPTNIYSFELTAQLPEQGIIRRILRPLVTTISFAASASYINDPEGAVYEFNPYLLFRWEHFPWDRYVVNTYAIGEGVSYDTRVTTWEKTDTNNTKRLLNYLALETTLALPKYPQLQLVVRIHHRSGAWGLYGAPLGTGSNFLGLGVRYYF